MTDRYPLKPKQRKLIRELDEILDKIVDTDLVELLEANSSHPSAVYDLSSALQLIRRKDALAREENSDVLY